MASRTVSWLLARSISSSGPRSALLPRGKKLGLVSRGGIHRYNSTAAAAEEPITPPVTVPHTQLLINGKFVDAASGRTFQTLDPRTGELIANVAEGDAEDVNRAVAAARKAFDEGPWPRLPAFERQKILLKCADLVDKHNDEIAALETWDNGKPYEQAAKVEVPMFARLFRYYAGWADKIHGLTVPADGPYHVQTLHEPIGVAGQIIPWNFPLLMFAWKVGPALATGNTIVLKTAEQTPLSALYVARLFHEAGLPEGVLNIISGFGPTAGAALASHMDVDKLAFTGSTETGKIVLELGAKSNLKPVTLELGGKSPFIVCEDADVDQAVELAHFALFFNQACACFCRTLASAAALDLVHSCTKKYTTNLLRKPRRVLQDAQSAIHSRPALNKALRYTSNKSFLTLTNSGSANFLKAGRVDSEQFEKILKYIRSGVECGATLETGGERHGSKGYYVQPTVFSNVKDDMLIAKDEIFGPVQSILKFKDLNEVIKRSNATRYGLAAGVFTQNIDTANTLIRALRVGTVWVNTFDIFDAAIPFGGYKMSGHGREKGIYSLSNYLQVKAVVTPLKNPAWL
ncbi:unnamed protein product [Linum tenue]|uniref:aldehyde dehydrogenase (NAD(+)) n=1 Tax=Linum tenue TaxID=586396 RepID=A0AAV0HNC1_9ROSI|nr:unnamed protein product [Linum tenue]